MRDNDEIKKLERELREETGEAKILSDDNFLRSSPKKKIDIKKITEIARRLHVEMMEDDKVYSAN